MSKSENALPLVENQCAEAEIENVSLDDVIESTSERDQSLPEQYFGSICQPLHYDDEANVFFIEHPFSQEYLIAVNKCLVPISPADAGSEVMINFDQGILDRPIVVGKVSPPSHTSIEQEIKLPIGENIDVDMDQKDRLVFRADKEIVLQCGKSSITLTRSGKVLIRGAYVSTRSSGVNKIKGGSVQLN